MTIILEYIKKLNINQFIKYSEQNKELVNSLNEMDYYQLLYDNNEKYQFDERAGILEFDGNINSNEKFRLAYIEILGDRKLLKNDE